MKNSFWIFVFVAWTAGIAKAETITVTPAGGCRGLFSPVSKDGLMFRNRNASIQGNGKCTLLLRTKGKRLNRIWLLARENRYSNTTVSRSFRVRPTSSGYAIDFNYYPNICFYYLEAQGVRSNLSVEIVNSTLETHFICHGAV